MMKNNIKLFLFFTIFCICKSFAQVKTSITDVLVNNQTTVNNCGLIDFGSTSNNSLTVYFKLTKPSSQAIGNCNLKILFKYSSSSYGSERANVIVQSGSWANNNTEFIGTIVCNISESEIQITGSSVLIECTTDSNIKTQSCEYALKKTPTPTFTLTPTAVSIPCGSTAPVTFTVNNVYNSPGTLSYYWSVSGWKKDGVVVTSFTTTTNTINLVPNSYSPSNVYVWPVLNGVTQSQKMTTVTLAPFTNATSITGNNAICPPTSAVYSISDLGSGSTISWSTSNTSIATVTPTSGNQATVNPIATQGTFNLIAVITNACGQQKTLTKILSIGLPRIQVAGEVIVQQPDIIRIQMQNTDGSPLSDQGITTTTWQKIASDGTSTSCATAYGGSISTLFYQLKVTATNSCGTTELIYDEDTLPVTYTGFDARASSNTNVYTIYPNPSKDIVNIDLLNQNNQPEKGAIISGELFDLMGQSKSKVEISNNKATFSVRELNKGIYVLKIFVNDQTESHQIVVE